MREEKLFLEELMRNFRVREILILFKIKNSAIINISLGGKASLDLPSYARGSSFAKICG